MKVLNRYHIGESLLASVRHFLKFIDVDDTMKSHGFTIKVGDSTGTSKGIVVEVGFSQAQRSSSTSTNEKHVCSILPLAALVTHMYSQTPISPHGTPTAFPGMS